MECGSPVASNTSLRKLADDIAVLVDPTDSNRAHHFMATWPSISVVIPTYNRRQVLARILSTIFDQDFPADAYEVIVAVDGSNDGTAGFVRTLKSPCRLRVIEQPNGGPASARNAGLRLACGDLVLFLDDDLLCDRGLLREHAAAHATADNLLAFGPVLASPESPDTLATQLVRPHMEIRQARLSGHVGARWPFELPIGANSSIRRSLVLTCGGFDERLRVYEDPDLAFRLFKFGVQPRYLAAAVTHQIYVKTPDQLVAADARWSGACAVLLSRKHPEFRPQTSLARLRQGRWYKQLLREAGVRFPLSIEPLLRGPYVTLSRLRRISSLGKLATLLLRGRAAVVRYRSALREVGSWETMRREFGMRLPVLLYHHVGPPRLGFYPGLTIDPHTFERQISYLKRRGYTSICPTQWLDWCLRGTPLPRKPVLITFDDGYADIADYALPVIRRYGFGATVFVVTGLLGETNVWDQRRGYASCRLMTAEQVHHWSGEGIAFGAHSRSHADLTELDHSALMDEVQGSADDLAAVLGARPLCFAYPYGRHNAAVRECVRRAFELAFAGEGFNHLGSDLHLLGRLEILPSDSLSVFACRMRLGFNPIDAPRLLGSARAKLTHFGP